MRRVAPAPGWRARSSMSSPTRFRRSSLAEAAGCDAVNRLDIHVARVLALGLGIGALALWPGPAGAWRVSPSARAASVSVALSNGRTISRWAYAHTATVVRQSASRRARPVGRLRYLTEDGQAEVYMALRETNVTETGGAWIEVSLPQRPNGVTGWVQASALGPLHVVAGRLVVSRSRLSRDAVRPSWACDLERPRRHRPAVVAHAGRPLLRTREAASDRQSRVSDRTPSGPAPTRRSSASGPAAASSAFTEPTNPSSSPATPHTAACACETRKSPACGTSSRSARRWTSPEDDAQRSGAGGTSSR